MSDESTIGLGVPVQFKALEDSTLDSLGQDPSDFNDWGVRELDDGSIDVAFGAMRPGVRNRVRITSDFLSSVPEYEYSRVPVQMDHDPSQQSNAGHVNFDAPKGGLWFDEREGPDGQLNLFVHVPNTGNQLRSDVISDFTHDPPAIRDGSLGFDPRTTAFDIPDGYEDITEWRMAVLFGKDPEPVELVEGQLQEFSLVTMPGGYDPENAGVGAAAFSSLQSPDTEQYESYAAFRAAYRSESDADADADDAPDPEATVDDTGEATSESESGREGGRGRARVTPTERSLPFSVTTHSAATDE